MEAASIRHSQCVLLHIYYPLGIRTIDVIEAAPALNLLTAQGAENKQEVW